LCYSEGARHERLAPPPKTMKMQMNTPVIVFMTACFPMVASIVSSQRQGVLESKERPVMKIVHLLQDTQKELQKELDDDKAVHEMLTCWCETNRKEKTAAIELGEATSKQLQSTMDEATAKIMELKEKRTATLAEVDANHAALVAASALRMKESKAAQAENTDLEEAAKACQQAVVVLKSHQPDNAGLSSAQLSAVARKLQAARVPQLLARSASIPGQQLDLVRNFMRQAATGASFLAIPGYQSYASQSGQIFGVLQQMAEDFEASLSEAQQAEKKAQEDYAALKAAKEEEIAAGRKAIVQFDADIADFSEKHAQAAQELEDTQAQLDLDRQFLENLEAKCAESKEEFDKRMKSRSDEIAAVADTIEILNTDKAFDNYAKTVGNTRGLADATADVTDVSNAFLQTASQSREQAQRRQRAISLLKRALEGATSPGAALVLASVSMDSFDKVVEEVDKLVVELGKQQQDEVEQRDWCIDELAKNDRSTTASDEQKVSLQTKIADLDKSIETLTADIETATNTVAETQKQMSRGSDNREAENAEFQETVNDQRMTQIILTKATARMKEVYAFLQQQKPGAAHIVTSATHTNAGNGPAKFTKYEQNAAGSRIVAMLETVMSDSKKMEDDAIRSEEDSQNAYENFMKASNKAITHETESIANMSENRAKAKEARTMAKTDLKRTMEELEDLNDMKGDIHKSCDFVQKNFDARQAARAAEMDALREAKAILRGMK
jgi:hypothetical protein